MSAQKHDPDVLPPTPFGPGDEWPATYELMVGVGSFMNADSDFEPKKYVPVKHLHPGPLGFVS
jgi:hypothetical protein